MSYADAIHHKAAQIGKLAVEMTSAAGSGHPSTALSLAHIVSVLMYGQMRFDPKNPEDLSSDLDARCRQRWSSPPPASRSVRPCGEWRRRSS